MAIRKIVSRSIGTDVIVAEDIANNAITVAELANGAVTNAKIATGAISTDKLDSTAIRSGLKNRIINGAMVIDQRNAGASVTPTTGGTYTLDRWQFSLTQSSKFSTQQNAGSVTPPAGFSNYLGVTSLSAYSVQASDFTSLNQAIEGFNTADLGWGTANAKTVTLSFQVYSSLTGTFGGAITNGANTYSYPFAFTISSANTWTPISITIAGPTAGTWIGATNGIGMYLRINLGSGSTYQGTAGAWVSGGLITSSTGAVNAIATNGATFYITGVQLEVGASATGYEYRQYGTELALCQRYCYVISNSSVNSQMVVASGFCYNSSNINLWTVLPVTPRTIPTGITVTSVGGAFCNQPGANSNLSSLTFGGSGNTTLVTLSAAAPGAITGQPCNILANSGSGAFSITFTGMEL